MDNPSAISVGIPNVNRPNNAATAAKARSKYPVVASYGEMFVAAKGGGTECIGDMGGASTETFSQPYAAQPLFSSQHS